MSAPHEADSILSGPDGYSAPRSSASAPTPVLLVSSWGTTCGIASHSESLIHHSMGSGFSLEPDAPSLDPGVLMPLVGTRDWRWPIVHLNHHDALHSRWNGEHLHRLQHAGVKTVVTYHDTREHPNSAKLHAFAQTADAVIVHEQVEDLSCISLNPEAGPWQDRLPVVGRRNATVGYLRQGVPEPASTVANFWLVPHADRLVCNFVRPNGFRDQGSFKAFPTQPVLGTVGFNFPWKNFDRLCELTASLGWAIVILSNNATQEDVDRWWTMNPHSHIVTGRLEERTIVSYLAACDATAFPYECSNTGTSGAIRLGIAARKPVLAFRDCRQFRDLYAAYPRDLAWVKDWPDLEGMLDRHMGAGSGVPWQEPRVASMARKDSWSNVAKVYHALYRQVLGVA